MLALPKAPTAAASSNPPTYSNLVASVAAC